MRVVNPVWFLDINIVGKSAPPFLPEREREKEREREREG
jgi:hypothetical protein